MANSVNATKLIGIYPGTFDPITLGHMDIIERAMKIVDHLVIGVADNPNKQPLFDLELRTSMIKGAIGANEKLEGKSIEIIPFSKLLIHFVEDVKAQIIVRGLRAVSDFEYEFQMTGMNSYLNSDVETIFLMAKNKHQFISSSFIREVGRLGGDISRFVPANVNQALKEKFGE